MELENRMSQAAQDLSTGETRHESRENHSPDDEDVPGREEVQWMKQTLSRLNERTSVDRGTTRELSKHISRARSTDVHVTRRHEQAHTNNHTRVGALWSHHPRCDCTPSLSRQGHERYTAARKGSPWVARTHHKKTTNKWSSVKHVQ